MYDKQRKKSSSSSSFFFSLMFIAWLPTYREEEKMFVYICSLMNDQPMKKWSAQPTGNGKRIIIIITTLLLFRKCLKAVGEKKRRRRRRRRRGEKSSFPLVYFFYYAKKKRERKLTYTHTHTLSNIDLSCLVIHNISREERKDISCTTLYFSIDNQHYEE